MMKQFICTGALFLLLPIILVGQGSTYKYGTTVRVNKTDTIPDNVIAAAQFVDIFGHLSNDLFSASRNIVINGSIDDDAIIAGRTVTFSGRIGDMLIAAGETVVIDGEITGDLFVASNKIRLTSNAHISGNVGLAGNEVIFENGIIEGWVRITGNTIFLDGSISGIVKLYGNDFTFGKNYHPLSATIVNTSHRITESDLPNAPNDLNINIEEKEENWGVALLFGVWFYISTLIIGFLIILLFRNTTGDLYRFSTENYFKNTGIGILLFLGIPIVITLFLVLVVTIPLSIMIMTLYGLTLFLGFLLVALSLGTSSIRYFKSEETFADYYWGLALGIILIFLLSVLPYAGPVINLILIFLGLGTLLSYFWQMRGNAI